MATIKLDLFREFFRSEKAGGFVLIGCTIISLVLANSSLSAQYLQLWEMYSIGHWINDGLMAIFFLLVGLEIERELYVGELSSVRNALLPVLAAIGGMAVPALVHYIFNAGTPTQAGFGIPMATDIAFALGILSLAGKGVPVSLKIFLTALAIIDDLGAITVIGLFYTKNFSLTYLLLALLVFGILFVSGKKKIYNLVYYLVGGVILWYFMLQSGVHATIAGVLLAFAIPFHKEDDKNPSYKLQHALHFPVAFFILPLFALANTAIVFPENLLAVFLTANSIGIMLGLVLGKFAGIFLLSFISVKTGIAKLSEDLNWRYIAGISFLGGIGFTMSIFITNLAFDDPETITGGKMSTLAASFVSALIGLAILKWQAGKRQSGS